MGNGARGQTIICGRALSAGEIDAIITSCLADDSLGALQDCAVNIKHLGTGMRSVGQVVQDLWNFSLASEDQGVCRRKGRSWQ